MTVSRSDAGFSNVDKGNDDRTGYRYYLSSVVRPFWSRWGVDALKPVARAAVDLRSRHTDLGIKLILQGPALGGAFRLSLDRAKWCFGNLGLERSERPVDWRDGLACNAGLGNSGEGEVTWI